MRESRGTSTDGISCSTGSSFASAIADNLLTKNFELSELLRPKLSTAIGVELSKADCREQAFQATKFIQRETATEETFSSRKLFQVHSCLRYEPLDVKVGAIAILRCAGAPEAAGHPHGRLCSHGVGKLPGDGVGKLVRVRVRTRRTRRPHTACGAFTVPYIGATTLPQLSPQL